MAGGPDYVATTNYVDHGTGTYHLRRPNESAFKWRARRLINTRTFASLDREVEDSQMKRVLSVWDLSALGVGAIIGTGIFVLTGVVANKHAGAAVSLSFVIAAIVSGLAALSYAEMASLVPIAGSAYTYTYATCGEFMAWIIGWDLILEYLVGAATVSVGFASYLKEFIHDAFGYKANEKFMAAPFKYQKDVFSTTDNYFSFPSFIIVILLTILLCRGVKASARVNNILVVVKLIVIVVFIFGTCKWVDTANFNPYIPPTPADEVPKFGFYGPTGVLRGATIVFFAYIGFDAISTAAQEARNPQRDLPISIGVSLIGCTVLYIATSLVLTGVVNYKDIHNTAAFKLATAATNQKWLTIFCEVGILAGLISVMLVLLVGQPRIFFSMAVDGLFPQVFSRLHPKYKTPVFTTALTGFICACAGGMFPVDLLADLTSVGTLFAFFLVHMSVLILRWREPNRPRRFKVPFGPVLPIIGGLCCIGLIAVDSVSAIIRLVVWLAIGVVIYIAYGSRNSRLNNPEKYATSEPMEVVGDHARVEMKSEVDDNNLHHLGHEQKV